MNQTIPFPKSELAGAVSVLGKLVSRTSPVECYRSIRVQCEPHGLRLSTASLNESGSVTLPLSSEAEAEPASAIVNFEALRTAVRNCRNKNVCLEFTEAALQVEGQPLPMIATEWPEVLPPKVRTEAPLPVGFIPSLASAAPVIDRHNCRAILQGLHLSGDGVVTTNGKALLHIPMTLALPEPVTVPFPLMLLATKCQEEGAISVWQQANERYFQITVGPWTWSGKALTGSYPNWKQVIPNEKLLANEVQFKEAEKEAMLSYLKSIPDNPPNHPVTLSRSGNELVLSAKGSSHQVEAEFTKGWETFSIVINRDLLIQALQLKHTRLSFADNHMPFMAQGGTGTFVAMPLYFQNPNPNPKQEEKKMNETTNPVVTAPVQSVTINPNHTIAPTVEAANPLDDLAASIDAFKLKLRLISEESAQLSRKVKEVALSQKQKERDFIQAKRAIERIRMAI